MNSGESKKSVLRPLFPDVLPATINYCASLPAEGQEFKIEKLTPQELVAKIPSMTAWTESVLLDADMKLQKMDSDISALLPTEFSALTFVTSQRLSHLVICYMNEKVGHGVFAIRDIPKGRPIAYYAGHLQYQSDRYSDFSDPYSCTIDLGEKHTGVISAKKHRNIAAFIQHLPSSDNGDCGGMSLSNYTWTSSCSVSTSSIATANMVMESLSNYKEVPIVALHTCREIKKGEMLGYDYSATMWERMDKLPYLFTKKGVLLNPSDYRYSMIRLSLKIDGGYINVHLSEKKIRENFNQNLKLALGSEDDLDMVYGINQRDYEMALLFSHSGFALRFPRPSSSWNKRTNIKKEYIPAFAEEMHRFVCKPSSQYNPTLFKEINRENVVEKKSSEPMPLPTIQRCQFEHALSMCSSR